MQKSNIGREFESKACEYVSGLGMKVIDRNYTVRGGEIDIIAIDGEYLCFIEVKYRKAGMIAAYGSIDFRKQKRIIKTAEAYLYNNKLQYQPRFDTLIIVPDSGGLKYEYIKNAYDASSK